MRRSTRTGRRLPSGLRAVAGTALACLALGLLAAPAVAAPAWLAPVDLSVAGQTALGPQVAVDPQGNAVAVWYRWNGTNTIVQAAQRPAGGSWQSPVDLSVAGQEAYAPQVAVDPQGNAVAVWYRWNGANWIVQAAQRPAGGSWQSPLDLSVAGQSAGLPQVAVDPQGNAVAVWERWDGANVIIQAAQRPAGGSWQSPPVDLSVAGRNPQVAVDPQGDATAVWQRWDGANYIIQAAQRPAGGSWQSPVDLSAAGQNALQPQVAVDPQGDATAVWPRWDGANIIIQAAQRPAGGSWQSPLDLSVAGQDVWQDTYAPQVAVDPQGNAVAAWQRWDGASVIIQAAQRPAGGSWQSPVDLSAAGQSAFAPQVAVDPQGNAVAAWTLRTGSGYIIQAAGLDAVGPQLRSASIPTTGTVGQPLSFSVSPLDVWSALGATSWSFGDGASSDGTSATHTYATPGTYEVTLTSADALENTTSASGTIAVVPADNPPGGGTEVTMSATCTALGDGRAVIAGTVNGASGNIFADNLSRTSEKTYLRVASWVPYLDGTPFEVTTWTDWGPEKMLPPTSVVWPGDELEVWATDSPAPQEKGVVYAHVICVELEKSVTDVVGDLAAEGVLSQGDANAILVKVDAATASAERGNIAAALHQLEAFKKEVAAMYGSGRLTQQQRDDLFAAADRKIAELTA